METTKTKKNTDSAAPRGDAPDIFRPESSGWRRFGYLLLRPRVRLMLSWGYHWRAHGKHNLRGFRHSGMFLYGNRTGTPLDALVPASLTDKPILVPAPADILAAYAPLMRHCAGLPTPETHRDVRPFLERLEKHTVRRGAVAVYAEDTAGDAPYLYPVRFDEPSFVFYTGIRKTDGGERYAVTTVAGPFYPDMTLPHHLRAHELGERLRAAMRDLAAVPEKEAPPRE